MNKRGKKALDKMRKLSWKAFLSVAVILATFLSFLFPAYSNHSKFEKAGEVSWNLIISLPYSEIAGPINENARDIYGLAGLLILLFGTLGIILFFSQKKKNQLEAERIYLKQVAEKAEALKESEEKLAGIIASVPARMCIIDEEYTIVWVNKVAEELFGTNLLGKKCYAVFYKRTFACCSCFLRKCFEDGKTHEHEIEVIGADGSHMMFRCTASVASRDKNGRPRTVVEVSYNITQHKLTEELLLREKNKVQQYLDVAEVILAAVNADQKITLMNKKGCEVLGYKEEEIIGKNWFDCVIPEGIRDEVRGVFNKLMAGEIEPVKYFENPVLTKNGRERIIAWHNTVIRDHDGRIISALASGEDITERKKAEEERIRLATAIDQVSESVIVISPDWTIQYANSAFERICNLSRDEVVGQDVSILSGQHCNTYDEEIKNTVLCSRIWRGRLVNKREDGSCYEVEVTISPIKDKAGNIINYMEIQRDISQEAILERQLRQTQKMEAIGTLAGGIAHDFNNMLGAIMGYIQLTLLDIPEENLLRSNLEEVLKASCRARDLVKQILTFSRRSDQYKKPVAFSSIIKEALKLLRPSLPSTIEIHQNIEDDSALVLADPTQIHQVLINLCTNAAHAMRDTGGVLKIELTDANLKKEEVVLFPGMRPGSYLRLSVSDTGHGISPEIMDRIFDPFYTTKEPNEGTGMGLSVVHGIVKSHGGMITVLSTPGKGSAFHLFFPRVNGKSAESAEISKPLLKGHERILLVDDESSLAYTCRRMLEFLGYEVVTKTSSLEALEYFRSQPDKFDLVITDQTMPDLTGAELAQRLLSLRPDLPIILSTGFSETITMEKAMAIGIRKFFMKPFTIDTLGEAIRAVLP